MPLNPPVTPAPSDPGEFSNAAANPAAPGDFDPVAPAPADPGLLATPTAPAPTVPGKF